MNTKFIQIGQRFFSVQHITAISLDATIGCGEHPAVALYLAGDDAPWKFRHGTPEADALISYARGNVERKEPFQVGDCVQVMTHDSSFEGMIGEVKSTSPLTLLIRGSDDVFDIGPFDPDELELVK